MENALESRVLFLFWIVDFFLFLSVLSNQSFSFPSHRHRHSSLLSEQKKGKQILYKDVNNQARTNKQTPKCADGEMTTREIG